MKRALFQPCFYRLLPVFVIGTLLVTLSVETQGQSKRDGLFRFFGGRSASNSSSTEETTTLKKPSQQPLFDDRKSLALKSKLMQVIPSDRHYRETMADAITLVYRQNRFRPLWNARRMPAQLQSILGSQLLRHGIASKLALDPSSITSSSRGAPVNTKDLGYTVAIADAGMLVKMGPVDATVIWPDWNTGDRPGTSRSEAQAIARDLSTIVTFGRFDASAAVDIMAPRNWVYRELQNGYISSRQARDRNLPSLPHPSSAGVARPGQACSYAPALAEILAMKGFLRMLPTLRANLTSLTPELTAAIKSFQRAYGLDADGIVGSGTWSYLNDNPATQYQARLINLHRARFLNDDLGERYLLINLPNAELFGFEKQDAHSLTMRVVHGKAAEPNSHTPVFRDVMKEVVFAPYWNVPESISTKEIYPKMIEDPTYLERNHYELVYNFKDDTEVQELNEKTLAQIESGDMWLRQRPNSGNALGKVKFLLPNQFHIYLHDTLSKQYFKLDNRDHSHGCIRLAEPSTLASWVLANQGWDDTAITEAMNAETQSREKLKKSINVYITYFTVFPRPRGRSTGEFALAPARDVYNMDSQLAEKLAAYLP